MGAVEILLIILGIIIIIISCVYVDKAQGKGDGFKAGHIIDDTINTKISQMKQKELSNELDILKENLIEKTEIELDRLSNEKIMAVSEYSDQILDKINNNHEEVIFLYKMLNDKENELKHTLSEADLTISNKIKEVQGSVPYEKSKESKVQVDNKKSNKQAQFSSKLGNKNHQSEVNQASPEKDHTTEILAFYSQGKSITEISKLLQLGQGEVKLIIDLYNGK